MEHKIIEINGVRYKCQPIDEYKFDKYGKYFYNTITGMIYKDDKGLGSVWSYGEFAVPSKGGLEIIAQSKNLLQNIPVESF